MSEKSKKELEQAAIEEVRRGGLDESGTLKKLIPDNKELQKIDDEVGILVLTRGELADGSPFYAYLSVPPSKYESFLAAESRGSYNLSDYGDILSYGEESEPPAEVIAEMREKYGAEPDFEEQLFNAVKRAAEEEENKTKD